jgi:hypothetical protein
VREENSAREQRPITVVVNVTAADANSFAPARARSRPTWRARSTGRVGTGERPRISSAPLWRRSRCCPGDCRSCCSGASARGRAAWCTAAGRAAAAGRRCGSAFGTRHRSRRPHARRADHRAGWHSAVECSCYVPLQQSYARAGRRARAACTGCGPAVTGGVDERLS